MHRMLITLLLCLTPLPMFPEAGSEIVIHGYIKDARSGETLIQANVYLKESARGATSNNSGYFMITDVPPGQYTLVASYIGYRDFRKQITLHPGQRLRLDIELQPVLVEGREVVVEARASIEEEKQVGMVEVTPLFVKQLPSVFEADLFRSLQLLPGIKAASDFSSGLYIRGGSPDQTLTLIDRTTVYNPSHFFGFFSTFNPDAIKDVRVYKGGYPAEYGGRLGSVIDIYNRDGNRKEFEGRATIGLLASRINLEGPFKKGSWMIAARRSTLEPVLAALRKNIDDVPDAFYFYDLNGKLNYDPGPNDRLSLAFYGGNDHVRFPFADDADFNLDYGNLTLSANWTHVFSQTVFSNFTLTGSRYFNYPRFNISGTRFERDNELNDVSAKGDFEYIPNSRHTMKAGFWVGGIELIIKNRFDDLETLDAFLQDRHAVLYFQDKWRPDPRWVLTAGLRSSYAKKGNYLRFEPRLSLEHIYTENLLFQLAYGRYYQHLTLVSNEAFSGFDTWLITDEGVPPSWGDQFIAGFKSRFSERWGFDMELYYRTMRDLFEFDPRIPDVAGLEYADLFRFGEGYAYGAEFMLQKKSGALNGFIGYTLGLTRRKFPGYNDNRFYPPKYDRTHDLNIVMNYRLSRRWKLTGVFSYATGQAYTDIEGSYYFRFPSSSLDRTAFLVGRLNTARLPAYHRLDVGFTRQGKFLGWGEYQLNLQVINLYSRRNIWFYTYDLDDNPFTREDVRMLPILPNISFTVNF